MPENSREKQDPATPPMAHEAGREGQLRIARAMKREGHYYQAIHSLSELLVGYPADPDARIAAEELASIAQDCERRGFVYTALNLYRQLERLQ